MSIDCLVECILCTGEYDCCYIQNFLFPPMWIPTCNQLLRIGKSVSYKSCSFRRLEPSVTVSANMFSWSTFCIFIVHYEWGRNKMILSLTSCIDVGNWDSLRERRLGICGNVFCHSETIITLHGLCRLSRIQKLLKEKKTYIFLW